MSALPEPLMEHLRAPRNCGELPGASAVGRAANQACGDELLLALRVEEGRVAQARFQARGCSATLACASLATEALAGLDLAAAAALDLGRLVREAGGLPPTRRHAVELCARALHAALGDHRARCHP